MWTPHTYERGDKESQTQSNERFKGNEDSLHESHREDVSRAICQVTYIAPYISICRRVFKAQDSKTVPTSLLKATRLQHWIQRKILKKSLGLDL